MITRIKARIKPYVVKHNWLHFLIHFTVCRFFDRIEGKPYTEYTPQKWMDVFGIMPGDKEVSR